MHIDAAEAATLCTFDPLLIAIAIAIEIAMGKHVVLARRLDALAMRTNESAKIARWPLLNLAKLDTR